MFRLPCALAAAFAAALVFSQVALAQPVPLRKQHAYGGSPRPLAQIATVYGTTLTRPGLALTYVCKIDGKSYRATIAFGSISICPSIVYLLPGNHQLVVQHGRGYAGGTGTISGNVAAGRVYEIVIDQVESMRVSIRLQEKPPGFVLTYKDVSPGPFLSGMRQNSNINPAVD